MEDNGFIIKASTAIIPGIGYRWLIPIIHTVEFPRPMNIFMGYEVYKQNPETNRSGMQKVLFDQPFKVEHRKEKNQYVSEQLLKQLTKTQETLTPRGSYLDKDYRWLKKAFIPNSQELKEEVIKGIKTQQKAIDVMLYIVTYADASLPEAQDYYNKVKKELNIV